MNIILASQSPRRKELLGLLQLPFTQQVAEINETLDRDLPIAQAVADLSRRKAEAIPHSKEDLIIAADTVVVLGDTVLGKPKDEEDAFNMLCKLSGRAHKVLTGLTVLHGENPISCTEETEVFFRSLSPEEIRNYIATGEPMDKAGSYGIQGYGGLFVEKIYGDYYNVVGLPVCRLSQILKEIREETK